MYIYRIINLINWKQYVGQTYKPVKSRLGEHYRFKKTLISKALRKYGKENFIIEQIDTAQTQRELDLKEILWIEYLGTHISLGNGYNVDWGGNNKGKHCQETKLKISNSQKGRKHSEETKRKMSESSKGQVISQEQRDKLSKMFKGSGHLLYGKTPSKETREKLSKSLKGKNTWSKGIELSDSHKNKISNTLKGRVPWNKGKVASEETKLKMSNSQKGRKHSEETKLKMSNSQKSRKS
jgi:hypothetical protein